MKIIIEGMLISTYVKPDFKDKDSGEVTKGKPVLQLLVDTELSNGSIKQEMQDISIPIEKLSQYKDQVGKKVQVKCNFMSKSNVSFFVTN
ncbi:MAG: hypothetical protein PHQ93_03515 [Sulfurimonas sp.]|uniref:hypothetical protein n=1 Tax=Sulfurimonas sp. TaxID=2022749 RepID=UPI0026361D50|nr:hypothetical protein [Sulfurimonas sp.]MDD5400241.1 hypothetical protein [Sulfurimonas sp.]